jgi:hypothetical protein
MTNCRIKLLTNHIITTLISYGAIYWKDRKLVPNTRT